MSDTSTLPPQASSALTKALSHLTTHWQTSLVGVAFLGLAVAAQLGVTLPAIGEVHLTPLQLAEAGLTALGFLVARDGNK